MRRALFVLVLVELAACEQKKGEPSGLGHWRFGHTTAGMAAKEGLCDKTTANDGRAVTWCHQMPPVKIANRSATVDIYFDGHADDAPMIEIQLGVRGCVEDGLDGWLRSAFGAPVETRANRAYWQNSHMWVAGLMPDQPGHCLVHMLPLSEKSEIERIKQK